MTRRQQSLPLKIKQLISEREELLQLIKSTKTMKVKITQLQKQLSQQLLRLRELTLSIVESIKTWQDQLKIHDLKFPYENYENYVDQLKTDTNFLYQQPFASLLHLPEKFDPFLILKNCKSKQTQKIIVPQLNYSASRVNYAKSLLGLKPDIIIRKQIHRQATSSQPISPRNAKQLNRYRTFKNNSNFSIKQSLMYSQRQETKYLSKLILEDLLDIIDDKFITDLAIRALDQMVRATLVLFSSKIQDDIITQCIFQMIPDIASLSYEEVKDTEYIDFLDDVVEEGIDIVLTQIVNHQGNNLIAVQIFESLSIQVDYLDYIQEAIQEEKQLNKKLVELIFFDLLNQIDQGDWFEILVENEVSNYHLDQMLQILPPDIQTRIFNEEKPKYITKLAEEFYFQILNETVADNWTPQLLKYSLLECQFNREDIEPELDILMPIN